MILPGQRDESGESRESSIFEIAKKRFNLDKEQETMKLKKEFETMTKIETIDELLNS